MGDVLPVGGGPGPAPAAGRREDAQTIRARQAAEEFESILLAQLLKGLRRTIPEGGDEARMGQTYRELMDEQVAIEVARKGGIGLREAILAYLGQRPQGAPRP
jgi:flagellar protein FlgJ